MTGKGYILVLGNGVPTRDCLSGIFAYDQAKALYKAGYNVIYAALDLRSILRKRKLGWTVFEQDGMKVYNLSVPIGRVPLRLMSLLSGLYFNKLLKRIVKENGKPRLIHAHFCRGKEYLCKTKQKYGIEYVITEHDSLVARDMITEYERKNLRRIYSGALQRIAVSNPFADRLRSIYGIDFDVVYNVLDTSAFGNVENTPKEHDTFNFISVGSLIPRKGFVELITAFSELTIDAKLYIIGKGPQEELLRKLIEERGLKEKIFLVGQKMRAEIVEYMRIADCFVLASKKETFGVVYIEAMACGLPVIATRCGGPENFVTEESGIIVEVDDVAALRTAMLYMADNKNAYDSEQVRKLCLDTFSEKAFTDKIHRIIGEPIMSELKR